MSLTIKRLHELSETELLAFGVFMRGEIKPESISAGSKWVCQKWQKPHYWGDKYLGELKDHNLATWVALEDGDPVGFTSVTKDGPDRMITLFLVDTRMTPGAQEKVADALAMRGIENVAARGESLEKTSLIIPYKLDPMGEAYADRCGFSKVKEPTVSNPRRITFAQLKKNIEARRG